MFQISEVQESPAFNGRRSFLTLRVSTFQQQTDLKPLSHFTVAENLTRDREARKRRHPFCQNLS